MRKIFLFTALFVATCILQADHIDQKAVLNQDEQIERFVNNVRDKTALYGTINYLASIGMEKGFNTLGDSIEDDSSWSKMLCDLGSMSSAIPMLAYFHLHFANEFSSALLEKDSSFVLRLCSNFNFPLSSNFDLSKDVTLAATEEVGRLGIYKGAQQFFGKEDQRIHRRCTRVLGKSLLAGLLSFFGCKWKGLKGREWSEALVTFFSRLIVYSYSEGMAEKFLNSDELKKFFEFWKKGKDFDASLWDTIHLTEEGTSFLYVACVIVCITGILSFGYKVATGKGQQISNVAGLFLHAFNILTLRSY